MKIKHMLYSLLLIFTLLPVCVFGIFMVLENDKKVESILREDLAAISGAQILDISEFCASRQQGMERISQYTIIQDAVLNSLGKSKWNDNKTEQYVYDVLIGLDKYNPYLETITILDKNCKVVASSDEPAVVDRKVLKSADIAHRENHFYIGDVYERKIEGDAVQRLVSAVQGIYCENELIGYVVEEIATSYFDRFRSNSKLWRNGTLYLLDGNNELITAGRPEEQSRVKFATSEEDRENFIKAFRAIDHNVTPSGCISYEMGGDTWLTYFAEFDNTDWEIRLSINLSEYKSNVNSYGTLIIIILVTLASVLLLTSYFLSKRLSMPVNRIAEVLGTIQREQNYSLRVPGTANDEMGFLGRKINELLDYIEQERYEIQQAERDPLTGLRNQKAMEREVQEMLQHAVQTGGRIAIGYVDVDDFREINNQYGHLEGDACIRFVASVLEENIEGLVGRSNGDAFSFCLKNADSTDAAKRIAGLLLDKLNVGYFSHIANKQMPVPCSIGIAIDRGQHLSYSGLIHQATEALYQAKEKGKNTYHVFSREEMGGNLFGSNERVLALLEALHHCVANDCAGFYLQYQPLINASDGKTIGMESLLRWSWEPFGEVSPGTFVPLIEDDSCFFKLGNWILKQSLLEAMPIIKRQPKFMVHVNVAYSQLVRHEFQNAVMEILKETEFPAGNLCLELTERCRALDMTYLREVMEYFHTQGIAIALDDFGTGFSSLNLLRQLPVDIIKIDQSFIFSVKQNPADQAIVKSVIQCAESLDMEVCAEGVENSSIREYLLQYPHLVHQGFLYSKPVCIEEFTRDLLAGK